MALHDLHESVGLIAGRAVDAVEVTVEAGLFHHGNKGRARCPRTQMKNQPSCPQKIEQCGRLPSKQQGDNPGVAQQTITFDQIRSIAAIRQTIDQVIKDPEAITCGIGIEHLRDDFRGFWNMVAAFKKGATFDIV